MGSSSGMEGELVTNAVFARFTALGRGGCGTVRGTAWRGHRHKRLKESWCSCVSFNDSSQYNN